MSIDNIARDLRMYAEEGRGQEIVNLLREFLNSIFDTLITIFDERRASSPCGCEEGPWTGCIGSNLHKKKWGGPHPCEN